MTDGVRDKCPARSPAYQQFDRWLKTKATDMEKADYEEKKKNPDNARAYRTEWAAKKMKEAEEECQKATSYRKVQSKNGVYRSFSRIVKEEVYWIAATNQDEPRRATTNQD